MNIKPSGTSKSRRTCGSGTNGCGSIAEIEARLQDITHLFGDGSGEVGTSVETNDSGLLGGT